MLYLEDYLELVEHLPQELRDRLTLIREKDLQVNNSSLHIDTKVKKFFAEAKDLSPEKRQCEYETILKDYEKSIKYADNKLEQADQTHDIMIKLIQKLDGELEKFKLELEADHAGITEQLERRSLELDAETRDETTKSHLNNVPSSASHSKHFKDRRRSDHKQQNHLHYRHHPYQKNKHNNNGYHASAKLSHQLYDNITSSHNKQMPQNYYQNHQNGGNGSRFVNGNYNHDISNHDSSNTSSPSPYGLVGSLSSTMSSGPGSISGDFMLNGSANLEIDGVGHYGSNLTSFGNNSGFKNTCKTQNNNLPFNHQQSALSAALSSTPIPTTQNINSPVGVINSSSIQNNKISSNNINNNNNSGGREKGNHLLDPSEPFARQVLSNLVGAFYQRDETKYCVCRQISYGEMVACDNEECEIEWFHYDCVGITQPPKGTWYCPECTNKMNGNHHFNTSSQQTQTHKKRGRKELIAN